MYFLLLHNNDFLIFPYIIDAMPVNTHNIMFLQY